MHLGAGIGDVLRAFGQAAGNQDQAGRTERRRLVDGAAVLLDRPGTTRGIGCRE